MVTKTVKKQNALSYKAFLLNKVLGLHGDGEELNYKLYMDYYKPEESEGEEPVKKKQYRLDSMKLVMYWGQEMNDAFFDTAVKQAGNAEYAEVMKQDRRYPYFFLTHLLKVTLECLQEYFQMDVETSAEMEVKRPDSVERKRRGMFTKEGLYARFVMAASLYEKFAEQFLGDAVEKFVEQAKLVEERIKRIADEWNVSTEVLMKGELEEKDLGKLTTQMQEELEKLRRDETLLLARTEWAKQYADYRMYLDAFCAIIYLIEFHMVNRRENVIPQKLKSDEMEAKLELVLGEISEYFLMDSEQRMNRAAKVLYEKFLAKKEQQRLLLELCGMSERKEEKEKAFVRLRDFMCKVKESTNLGDTELHKVVAEIAKNCLNEAKAE